MSRRTAAFTQADIHRALKAARQAQPGVLFEVIIGGGVARIVPAGAIAGEPASPAVPTVEPPGLDRGLPEAP